MAGIKGISKHPFAKWIVPIIVLLLVGGLSWEGGYLLASDGKDRQQTTTAYKENAKASAKRTCINVTPVRMFECIDQQIEAAGEHAHADQKLKAEQRAAFSGLASAVVSFLALCATIAGLFFVRETLRATLTAVEDTTNATQEMRRANEIAENNFKAMVDSVSREHVRDRALLLAEKDRSQGTLQVKFRNFGNSLAQIIGCRIESFEVEPDRDSFFWNLRLTRLFTHIVAANESIEGIDIFPEAGSGIVIGLVIYADYQSNFEAMTFRFDLVGSNWVQHPGYYWNAQWRVPRKTVDEQNPGKNIGH
ncbi:hypothetical protein [Sphingomonas sp. PAMC 26605]|uniref:hypothetical protein n=1 Tax=Sphingomonas sp. PAMC 26605 TaxID=1112214 RepID=UPI00026CDCC7|nr:hypothetical protein [Sphingomonas sp. PAMC 26605]